MIMKNLNVKQKNINISVLRGIFTIMIVLHHLNLYIGGGSLGVTFFFILGGFALSLGYYDKVNSSSFSYTLFMKKRIEKFFPLHWLCLLAVIPLALIPVIRGTTSFVMFLVPLIPNVLLLQSLIPIKEVYFSFNSVSWYLSDTMMFALVFPFIVKGLSSLEYNKKLVVFAIIILSYFSLVYFLPKEYWHAILYINPFVRFIEFIIGIYLYILYKKFDLKSIFRICKLKDEYLEILVFLMLLFSILISCFVSKYTRLISAIYWIPLSVILICSVLIRSYRGVLNSVLMWIGEMSLPIFLIHQVVIRYVQLIFRFIGLNNFLVEVLVIISLIIIASWLCDKYFLRPLSLWLNERKN